MGKYSADISDKNSNNNCLFFCLFFFVYFFLFIFSVLLYLLLFFITRNWCAALQWRRFLIKPKIRCNLGPRGYFYTKIFAFFDWVKTKHRSSRTPNAIPDSKHLFYTKILPFLHQFFYTEIFAFVLKDIINPWRKNGVSTPGKRRRKSAFWKK